MSFQNLCVFDLLLFSLFFLLRMCFEFWLKLCRKGDYIFMEKVKTNVLEYFWQLRAYILLFLWKPQKFHTLIRLVLLQVSYTIPYAKIWKLVSKTMKLNLFTACSGLKLLSWWISRSVQFTYWIKHAMRPVRNGLNFWTHKSWFEPTTCNNKDYIMIYDILLTNLKFIIYMYLIKFNIKKRHRHDLKLRHITKPSKIYN